MQPVNMEPIGVVRSAIKHTSDAPPQGPTAGTEAVIEINSRFKTGLADLEAGMDIWVLVYFDKADGPVMQVHPQGNLNRPLRSLFATRAPCRPSPIGLSLVRILDINGCRLNVRGLEAIDGTPVLDIKPYNAVLDSPRPEKKHDK